MKDLITPVNGPGVQSIPDHRFNDLIESFVTDQDVSPSSKSNYERILKQFFKWVKFSNRLFAGLTRVDILEYKEDLLSSGMSSLSVSTYLGSVRRFFDWCESKKLYPNIARGVRSPRRKQEFRKGSLNKEQCRALLDHYKYDIRNYAIISLLIGTGIRTIELIRANVEDLALKNGKRILYVHGKGKADKSEFVKLPEHTYHAISYYLSRRTKTLVKEPLFVSTSNNNFNERLSTRTISKIVKDGLIAIGLDSRDLTAHSLRHTAAVSIIKAGLPIEYAQSALRHASISTTQIYLTSIKDEMMLQNNSESILNQLMI